jgi:hypothetical protein
VTDRITNRRAGYMKVFIDRDDPPDSGLVFLVDDDEDEHRGKRVPRPEMPGEAK